MTESLEKFMEDFNNARTLGEIILGILSQIDKERITNNPDFWHPMFLELSTISTLSQIKELKFDLSPIVPWCDELDQTFFRLEMSNLLPFDLHTCEYLIGMTKEIQNKSFEKFNDEAKKELQTLAKLVMQEEIIYNQNKMAFPSKIKKLSP